MKKISKYQIFSELQHGPITRVYKAFQPELQRPVLVKQLNPDRIADAELVDRFQQEGLILAKIKSPYVIAIFDFGLEDGIPFLVTEFIEGTTLAGLVQQHGSLPWDIGLFILQQLGRGLEAIHHHHLIHRDIKPDNIFLSNEGDVKLGDLGFSTPLAQAEELIQGTPAYLAPEIVAGSAVDFRSDLYSLGVVGYEILTGENPFASDDVSTVLNRLINLKPLPVHKVRPAVPQQLSLLIARLMSHRLDQRFSSAKEFIQASEDWKMGAGITIDSSRLMSFMENPQHYQSVTIAKPELPLTPGPKTNMRRRPALVLAGLIAVILLVLLGRQLNHGFNSKPNASDSTSLSQPEAISPASDARQINAAPGQKERERELRSPAQHGLDASSEALNPDSSKVSGLSECLLDTVLLTTDPRARVFRQGDSLGITPLGIVIDTNAAVWEMEFHAPGFPAIRKTVNILPPVAQKIHINLWKEVGYFEIEIIPWGVVWIDGDSIDVTPLNRPIILASGNHRLMIRHPTLQSITEPFYIAAGETLRKSIQLQRAP